MNDNHYCPKKEGAISYKERKKALRYLLFLKAKLDGSIKDDDFMCHQHERRDVCGSNRHSQLIHACRDGARHAHVTGGHYSRSNRNVGVKIKQKMYGIISMASQS